MGRENGKDTENIWLAKANKHGEWNGGKYLGKENMWGLKEKKNGAGKQRKYVPLQNTSVHEIINIVASKLIWRYCDE